jgi:hypothetical protein
MGICQAKLTEEIRNMRKDMHDMGAEIRQEIRQEIQNLRAEILCTQGDATGVLHTVKIYSIYHQENPMLVAHALVWRKDEAFYLVSAAHVLVEICAMQERCKYELWWGIDQKAQDPAEKETLFRLTNLYLPKAYVLDGTHDVACSQLELTDTRDDLSRDPFSSTPLSLTKVQSQIGKMVVGHGGVYLKGSIVYSANKANRLVVDTPSIPGCSGCPLFDADRNLVGLVHGASKHRGKHSNANGKFNDMSHVVYADSLLQTTMHFLPEGFYHYLYCAEDVPLEAIDNDGSATFAEVKAKGANLESLRQIATYLQGENEDQFDEMTLNTLMTMLHDTIWSEETGCQVRPHLEFSNREHFCYFRRRDE